jgi:hypothetical protein
VECGDKDECRWIEPLTPNGRLAFATIVAKPPRITSL